MAIRDAICVCAEIELIRIPLTHLLSNLRFPGTLLDNPIGVRAPVSSTLLRHWQRTTEDPLITPEQRYERLFLTGYEIKMK